ncbi:MAG: hypothetical protein AB7V55_00335 [Oscillospiraceae bacterium]
MVYRVAEKENAFCECRLRSMSRKDFDITGEWEVCDDCSLPIEDTYQAKRCANE